jgi:peptidoglycan/LPS O-acetylase OafA/YrhL
MPVFQFGHAGVDLFFVISGFIITYVHYDDIGTPSRLGRYAARRFQRIYPLYWLATLVTLILGVVGWHFSPQAWLGLTLPTLVYGPLPGVLMLGSASYSIYLFQFIFIGLAWQVWTRLLPQGSAPDWVTFVVLAAAGIGGGVLVSRTCEYPLLGWIRRRMGAVRPRPGIPVA